MPLDDDDLSLADQPCYTFEHVFTRILSDVTRLQERISLDPAQP